MIWFTTGGVLSVQCLVFHLKILGIMIIWLTGNVA